MTHKFKTLAYAICTTILTLATACEKEENDIITEPTETSTVISGVITTTEGEPLANIPVAVDYKASSILGSLVKHKAKGLTDKSGCYRIFFETGEDKNDDVMKSYTFKIDLSTLSSERYVVPFTNSVYESRLYDDNLSGLSFSYILSVPKRKEVTVKIVNEGEPIESGEYAVRNSFVYGTYGEINGEKKSIESVLFTPVTVKQNGSTTVTTSCGIGIDNKIELVYRGPKDNVYYTSGVESSDAQVIRPTSRDEEVSLRYKTPVLL